jgi:hypothetical protein
MRIITLLVLSVVFRFSAVASAPVSSSISYQHISGNTYRVIYQAAFYCASIKQNSFSVLISGDSGQKSAVLTLVAVRNKTFNRSGSCVNNTLALEEHTYNYVLDLDTFNNGQFADDCRIRMSVSHCCKNSAITNMTQGASYYECMMDRCRAEGNSGPVFFNTGVEYPVLNQANYYNLSAMDTTDHDILEYELYTPMNAAGSFETYTGNFSARYPLSPYCILPGSVSCIPLPQSNPPRGLYMDSLNGNLIYVPVIQNEYAVVCYRVKEYRYINGIKQLIGYYITDNTFRVSILKKQLPLLKRKSPEFNYEFTANKPGVISFSSSMNDTTKKDSVKIFITHNLDGAAVNINAGWRPDGTFTWTPACEDVRKEPYFFIVNVYNSDTLTNQCQRFAVNIFVKSDLSLGKDTSFCSGGSLTLTSPLAGTYEWNGNPTSDKQSITVDSAGRYWLTLTRNSCSLTDTIRVTEEKSTVQFDLGKDTLLCDLSRNDILYFQLPDNYQYKYAWNLSLGNNRRDLYFKEEGILIASVANACGVSYDTIAIRRGISPQSKLMNDTTICSPFIMLLKAGQDQNTYLWNDGTSDSILQVNAAGVYSVKISNMCGAVSDSVKIFTMKSPRIDLLNDTIVCNARYPKLSLPDSGYTYLWSTGETSASVQPTDSGVYYVTATNRCGSASDSVKLRSVYSPHISLGPDLNLCNPISVRLNVTFPNCTYSWSTGSVQPFINVQEGGTYAVTVRNKCGAVMDIIHIQALDKPYVNLGRDTALQQPMNILLDAGAGFKSYRWNNSRSDTFSNFLVTSAGIYFVKVDNVCGTYIDTIIFSGMSGLQNLNKNILNVYPNPSNGIFRLGISTQIFDRIEVYNTEARMVTILNDQPEMMDLRFLSPGTYYLRILKDKQWLELLVVIE